VVEEVAEEGVDVEVVAAGVVLVVERRETRNGYRLPSLDDLLRI